MKSKKLYSYLIPLILVLGVVSLFGLKDQLGNNSGGIVIETHDKHRGVCWVGSSTVVDSATMKALAEKHVNWISQTPFGWQSGHDNPSIGSNRRMEDQSRVWWGERDAGLKTTTQLAKTYGINTILKPHIWLRDKEGKWRGEIAMNSEEDWQKWFKDYEEFILHYAQVAEESQMEMLCIGTELHQTCVEREQDWRALIKKIRAVYSGKLTYAANFSNEYEDVAFWDELDYIGIQAYFPLTDHNSPTLEEVRKGWQPHLTKLESFSNKYDKPILFTEAGYKSTLNSGIEPWEWPQRLSREERETIYSEETQATLYEAMFREVFDQPYIAGIHLWKWYPNYSKPADKSSNRRRFYDIDFTPQGKKAEEVMIDWYGKFGQ
ncbi:glycoside hydrolase family 113 [Roseivirga misakiensis]|uniref:GTA TIM-barrel-like domain-containing protein n=1 Tax=Roseivirga misakiensis TaxID=1563681 RepID=A0A1E5T350_9BACT|nr:hypothetical protein [Roseivirga misakiensis]OEK05809.1 hypothetical protein BFP71_06730 [Roseivirga misakiensis]